MFLLIRKVEVFEQFLLITKDFDLPLLLLCSLLSNSFWSFATLRVVLTLVQIKVAVHA